MSGVTHMETDVSICSKLMFINCNSPFWWQSPVIIFFFFNKNIKSYNILLNRIFSTATFSRFVVSVPVSIFLKSPAATAND